MNGARVITRLATSLNVRFHFVLKTLAQFHQLGRDNRQTIRIGFTFAFPIFLMIILCRIPSAGRLDRGDDFAILIGIGAGDGRFGGVMLCIVCRKDCRAILRADIIALTVKLGRIMRAQMHVVNLGERDRIGIERHADRFGVAGPARANFLVSRAGRITADIAAFDLRNAHDIAEHRFGAPEASACNNRLFAVRHNS